VESLHWKKKKKFRKDVEDYMIEYAVNNGKLEKDRLHKNALNSICAIPQTGRKLKVVFRKTGKESIKLITAYYLE
jgi:hypothetical protein